MTKRKKNIGEQAVEITLLVGDCAKQFKLRKPIPAKFKYMESDKEYMCYWNLECGYGATLVEAVVELCDQFPNTFFWLENTFDGNRIHEGKPVKLGKAMVEKRNTFKEYLEENK